MRLGNLSPCIDAGNNAAVVPDSGDRNANDDVTEPMSLDVARQPRFINDPETTDSGSGSAPIVDMGAYEYQAP